MRKLELHKQATTVIAHDHTMVGLAAHRRRGERAVFSSHYAPLIRQGGVNVIGLVVGGDFPLWGDPREDEWMRGRAPCWWGSLWLLDMLWQEAGESSDTLTICLRGCDIDAAVAADKCAVLLTTEGSRLVAEGPQLEPLLSLRTLYRLGLRSIQLVGGRWNPLVAASDGAEKTNGLTDLGIDIIQEMNHLGMVIDVAHIPDSDPLFRDIVDASQEPIIDSHDNVRTLTDLPWNNLSDERIRAIAGTGGVMGIKFRNSGPKPGADRVTVDDVVDHIDYIAGLVGVEHVGLGPDQVDRDVIGADTLSAEPEGLKDVAHTPRITEALVQRGYSEADIRKILGGNFLRVYKHVIG